MCPAAGKEITSDVCFELWFALGGSVKVSSIPEVNITDIEHAKNICSRCPHRKEWL